MSRLNNLASKAAEKIGFTVMPTWRLQHYEAAEHLRHLFDLYNVDLVMDVGANVGQYRDFLRLHVGYKGWIASYETGPEADEVLLKRSLDDARWRSVPEGTRPQSRYRHVQCFCRKHTELLSQAEFFRKRARQWQSHLLHNT